MGRLQSSTVPVGSQATFLDLFAGCGGLSRGFADAGFELIEAVEADLCAAGTFAANFGEDRTVWTDIAEYVRVPWVDVVVGGPPCQGFSGLGKRDPKDGRNRLWREYASVVKASHCKVFVLENVDRFEGSREMAALAREASPGGVLDGFEIEHYVLNAADYGVAQRRLRTVVIGSKVGPIGRPRVTHRRDPSGRQRAWRTLADAIEDLPYVPYDALPEAEIEFFGTSVGGAFKQADIHVGRTYTPTSLNRFVHIPPGGNRYDLPDDLKAPCWRRHTTGAYDVMGRLVWDRPSVTIRTEFFKPEKGRYLHPDMNRALTHAEAALIQGFDDRHLWCGTKRDIARQIGNAVPPPMATAIARRVLAALY